MRWSASCILSVPSLCPIIVMNYSPVHPNSKWCETDHTVLTCWCHDDTRALGFSRSHRIFPVRCSHEHQYFNREKTWLSAHVRILHIYISKYHISSLLVTSSSLLNNKYLILSGPFLCKTNPFGNFYVYGSVHRKYNYNKPTRCSSSQSLLFHCRVTLHVSGVFHTHHQEYIKLYLQPPVQVII